MKETVDRQTDRQTGGQVNKTGQTRMQPGRLKSRQTDKKAGAPTRQAGNSLKTPCVNGILMEGKHMFPTMDFP